MEPTVGVGGPFRLTSLETYPLHESESDYLSTSSTISGQMEHLSSKTLLDMKAELIPPSNNNILHGSEVVT